MLLLLLPPQCCCCCCWSQLLLRKDQPAGIRLTCCCCCGCRCCCCCGCCLSAIFSRCAANAARNTIRHCKCNLQRGRGAACREKERERTTGGSLRCGLYYRPWSWLNRNRLHCVKCCKWVFVRGVHCIFNWPANWQHQQRHQQIAAWPKLRLSEALNRYIDSLSIVRFVLFSY